MRHALFALALALAACHHGAGSTATPAPATSTDTRPLFVRLGGQPAIDAVVHELVQTTSSDPRINVFFLNTDKAKLEQAMDAHVCAITGGGCAYQGKPMREAHTGMKVTPEAFDAFMDDLAKTLAKLNVPAREQGEVIAAFKGLEADVLGH